MKEATKRQKIRTKARREEKIQTQIPATYEGTW